MWFISDSLEQSDKFHHIGQFPFKVIEELKMREIEDPKSLSCWFMNARQSISNEIIVASFILNGIVIS